MNDETFNKALGILGGLLLALGHSGLLPSGWGQFVGEAGTLIAGQALLRRRGDVPLSILPKEIQDSVRPVRV